VSKESNSCGAGCQSGCTNGGGTEAIVSVPTPTQRTDSNATTGVPINTTERPIPIDAENAHVSVDTHMKSTYTGCNEPCVVRVSEVELLYFPPATAASNGTARGLASISVSNGYTL